MKIEGSPSRKRSRFREWMVFSLLLTSSLVIVQSLMKIAERYFSEDVRIAVSTNVGAYVFSRLILVGGVSLFFSALATACKSDAPYTRARPNAADGRVTADSTTVPKNAPRL